MRFRRVFTILTFILCLSIWDVASAQFETRSSVPIGTSPFVIAVGDFDRDGKLDLAVTSYISTNSVAILLGNGDGTFRKGSVYAAGSQLSSLATADLRNNGILDLVLADSLNDDIYVLLGNGDGTFQAPVAYPTNGWSTSVAVGDFTGDRKLDIVAITNSVQCSCVTVLPGNGDGTFGIAVTTLVPYGITAFAVAPGFFDTDSKLDVAAVGFFGGTNQVDILLGNGDGTFQANGFYEVLSEPESIVAADFNGDKKTDLAIGNLIGASVSILLGNGDGTFQAAVNYATQAPTSVLAQDFNGDGKLDLAASDGGQLGIPAGISLLKGNGDGTFQSSEFFHAGREQVSFVAAGDFNGDRQSDLAVADFIDNQIIILLNTGVVSFLPTLPLAFPSQLVGTTSNQQRITLTNNGTTALTISSMTVEGPFGMTSNCGTSIAPGANCKISVTFSPQSKGMKSGTISIKDSASTKPQVIELSGQGTVVELSPSSLNFGSQKVGTKSAPQTITLTNQGITSLGITQISIGGINARDFAETNNCPSSLNAGATCTITVTFNPSKTGTRKAQVSITDHGGGSPQTVPLSGTGD